MDELPPADEAIARAAQAVADGLAVDWAALGDRVPDPDGRGQLECLRIIGAIASLHQSTATLPDDESTMPPDSANPPPKSAGEPWGRYRLLDPVGSGSFGSVYRAWDPQLEFEIAIKILHRHVADDELKAKLLDEGRALAKVRHANVVRVYGVESHEDRVGLCMEFVRGETLATAMSRGHRLNAREAAHVGQDICRALAAVHHAGFVHRDITARNIMRDQAGNIVLMDFGTGLRTTEDGAGAVVNVAGTPMYMAPEVLAGQPASPASDVYSVGVLLYYLVTGTFPIEGRTMDDLRAAHMVGRRTTLGERAPDLPLAFIKVVEHALVANPQQRCPSAAALLQELAAAGTERRSKTEYIAWSVAALAGAALGLTALGAVTTRFFNYTLGLSAFADDESVIAWFKMGAQASFTPALFLTLTVLAMGIMAVGIRLVLEASATARDHRGRLVNVARRFRLDDVSTLSSCALLLSVAALIATWLYFLPFLDSIAPSVAAPDISTAPVERLIFLSARSHDAHMRYREAFIAVTILCVVVWYPAIRLAVRKGESLNRSILAGGVAVLSLSLLLLDFPYRLVTLPERRKFEAVTWRGDDCFKLGERQAELLVFCPKAAKPRNRIVDRNDRDLRHSDRDEDMFAAFAAMK